jgi:hypothetical protein
MKNYVLVKSYYGWGGDLAILSEAISLASEKNLHLVIDWRGGFNGANHKENIFDYLFEVDCPRADISEIESDSTVLPAFWSDFIKLPTPFSKKYPLTRCSRDQLDDLLHSPVSPYVAVLTRESTRFYSAEFEQDKFNSYSKIKPKKFIVDQVDDFINSLDGTPFIGVHFRHGNGEPTVVYPDVNWYFGEIDKYLKITPNAKIFVCTDCSAGVQAFKNRYGDKVVSTKKNYLALGSGGMHYTCTLEDRIRSGVEAIIDIKLLSRSRYFIGTKSFFSYAVNGFAGGFDRSDIKTYVHRIRSFKPEKDFCPLSVDECLSVFGRVIDNLDGIYVRGVEGTRQIFLQDQNIGIVGDDKNELLERIKAIRLY